MQVFVKGLTGRTYTIDLERNDTIRDLKEKYGNKSFKGGDMRLIFAGKELQDDDVASDILRNESYVYGVVRLRGGGTSLPDIREMNTSEVSMATPETPPWECIEHGFNLHAICKNKNCRVFKKSFSELKIHKRFGDFDMVKINKKTHCPQCDEPVKIVGMGFFDCYYGFAGKVSETGRIIRGEGKADDKNYMQTSEGSKEEWDWLKIVVGKLPISKNVLSRLESN